MDIELSDILNKFKIFISSLKKVNGNAAVNETTIDSLFDSAAVLEDIIIQEEKYGLGKYLDKNYPDLIAYKPVELLLYTIIKNQNINESLTLYAIEKFQNFYSKEELAKVLDKILSEVDLRKNLYNIIEANPDVDLDLLKLNNFLCDVLNSPSVQFKLSTELKDQSNVLLKALKHCELVSGQQLMDELIFCLEMQTDLKLWFVLLKDENLETIVDLAVMYDCFLKAVLKFFDKFADEMESNFDEELNVQYSHVNLDFEDFVKVFQMFLNEKSIEEKMNGYLDGKTINDKNYCFWIDVKSCL